MKPIRLEPARVWRTYTGGSRIDALHGNRTAEDGHFPEEWLLSVVRARNTGREDITEGYSMAGNRRLVDLVAENPALLGGRTEPGVLVKLIDAAERLTVQVHPTKETAKTLFHSPYGKTECWHILGAAADEPPCIYLGFREGITRAFWQECFEKQDIPAMLGCLHKFPVSVGETYLICGGVPHAIGKGCFLMEIQEPTDFSVRTERTTPVGLQISDFMCHQGIGFEKMFDCFAYDGMSAAEVLRRYKLPPRTEGCVTTLVDYTQTPLFRMERLDIKTCMDVPQSTDFSGMYVLEGRGTAAGEPIAPGDQFFLPAQCDAFTIESEGLLTILRYYGPQKERI